MHRHGIGAIVARPHRVADSRHGLPIAPNLMIATLGPQAAAIRIWLADITYVSTADGCCTWRGSWTSVHGQRTFRENVQMSLGDGDCGSGISRYRNRHWSFETGGRGAWAAAGL